MQSHPDNKLEFFVNFERFPDVLCGVKLVFFPDIFEKYTIVRGGIFRMKGVIEKNGFVSSNHKKRDDFFNVFNLVREETRTERESHFRTVFYEKFRDFRIIRENRIANQCTWYSEGFESFSALSIANRDKNIFSLEKRSNLFLILFF